MIELRSGDLAWVVLVVIAVVYNQFAPTDELLSRAADRFRHKHPWVTRAAVVFTALHLGTEIPSRYDLFEILARAWRQFRRDVL